jgi:hypothetical protein
MDSIRILPSSLSKLAKDWKVKTMKSHFPHYFLLDTIKDTLTYSGSIPEYKYFESKRTTVEEYKEMQQEYADKDWNFLTVSKIYILDDCEALYQVLLKFFQTLTDKFPIDPLKVYSAPSAAFRIWRTTQLPKLNELNLEVYDLSNNYDASLRPGYLGGIVDVYRPHLEGIGYYYDVNSLYPTAMMKPMPIGSPKEMNITPNEFINSDFFGYVKAEVQSPENEYIGLLPIKLNGRLICPGGTFKGVFFRAKICIGEWL